jgi:hypothetical protein
MLVDNANNTASSADGGKNFSRGDKASVSVRLRDKKAAARKGVSLDNVVNKRLSSRHSGDFRFSLHSRRKQPFFILMMQAQLKVMTVF